ncbi:MAG: DUF1499 domain-containing protein [Luteitalea sp.]|nr:DUF1499 domain-containing protein [Luteitalea sp.]
MTTTSSKPSIPWLVLLGAALVVVSAILLLAAPLGYVTGTLPLRTALLTVFVWGAYAAAAAAVVSLAGLVLTLRRPKGARRGLALAALSFLLATSFIAIPGRFRLGDPKPPIHDISTDTQDPPQFVAVLPLRANAPNTTVYGGEKIATQQRAAYPDLQPYVMNMPPAQAFERALAAVRTIGWDLVAAEASDGRIEATDTTFWFRFKDDVIIRIRPSGAGSRVDVRSLSRVGGGDVGTNAARIRAYFDVLKAS